MDKDAGLKKNDSLNNFAGMKKSRLLTGDYVHEKKIRWTMSHRTL